MTLDPFATESEKDPIRLRIERLGPFVSQDQSRIFERILRATTLSGLVNVTGWTRDAVRILLTVLRDLNQSTTIKYGDRYFTPVAYPKGPMFEALVLTITEDEPWLISDIE
ncbi:MAG: hypothetical protein ACTSU3_02780 [Candidatus Thorarchaeota archaeon]